MTVSFDAVRDDGVPVFRELAGYVTIAEAVRITGYSEENIRRLVKRGRVRGGAVDHRTVLAHRASLLAYARRRGASEIEPTVLGPEADL